ncbi:putative reverse transcriptase domain-containing protein, partial [Tanacetum coccineum]
MRLNPETTPAATAATTTTVTNAQLQAMIDQGVTAILAACDANTNGVDSHNSGTGARRNDRATQATEMAIEVMDKRIRTFVDHQTENKRKQDNNQQPQQQHQNKRQNTNMAYAAGTVEKRQYGGSKPLFSKCNYHHDGLCAPKCYKCNKVGHFTRECKSMANANNANNQRGTGSGQKPTCFECGAQGYFKRECPKLKNNNNNRGNQVGGGNAPAKVYAVGDAGTNPDSNVVTGM